MVTETPLSVGPRSVGFRLPEKALVFGGDTLTATDIGVAAGLISLGDAGRVRHLPRGLIDAVRTRMTAMLEVGIDRMKTQADDITLIAAGGGPFLIPEQLCGVGRVLRVEHSVAIGRTVGEARGVTNK